MVATKPGHQGEHEGTRKTIAQGMPGDSGGPVVTNARAIYSTRAAAGASGIRHSLRPRLARDTDLAATRALSTPWERGWLSGSLKFK